MVHGFRDVAVCVAWFQGYGDLFQGYGGLCCILSGICRSVMRGFRDMAICVRDMAVCVAWFQGYGGLCRGYGGLCDAWFRGYGDLCYLISGKWWFVLHGFRDVTVCFRYMAVCAV